MQFRRTGWLALLLVAGLSIAPALPLHAQETQQVTIEPDPDAIKAELRGAQSSTEADDNAQSAGTAQADGQAAAASVPACARDPKKLGIERIVEIDTENGPVFGGSHGYNNFLKDREVLLTFDDGPLRAYTRNVLKALADHCTRATFFMVGRMAVADPGMVKEVAAAGHTVATHTYAHQNLKPLGLMKGRQEFESGLSAISKALGRPAAPFFRFPYLSESRQTLAHIKSRNTATFFIDVDSKDFQTRDGEIVFQRIMSQLASTRKGIILMHDIQPSTASMIRRLLDTLHAKGYKVVHMVPKAEAATLAEFDEPAARLLKDKAAKGKASPLAGRSVVWTMAPGAAGAGAQTARKPANAPVKTGSVTAAGGPPVIASPATDAEQLPWNATSSIKRPPAAARPVKRPQPRNADEDLPWQARVFAN